MLAVALVAVVALHSADTAVEAVDGGAPLDGGALALMPSGPSRAVIAAGRALARGDYADAEAQATRIADAGADDRERAEIIRGVADRGQGEFAAAAATLELNPNPGSLLEPYRLAYLGDALFYEGDYAGAAKAFSAAEAKTIVESFRRRLSGRLADALLENGQPCDAASVLRDARRMELAPERLDTFVRAQTACGASPDTEAAAHRLWTDFPDHPAAEALDAQERLHAVAADRIHRATRLLAHAQAARAADEAALGLRLQPTSAERAHLELLRAKALLELGQRPEALALLRAAVKHAPKSDAGRESQTDLARAAWRDGRIADAESMLQKLAASKSDHFGDDAAYLYAYLAFDRADGKPAFETASSRFLAFRDAHPRSHKDDEATWFAAYAAYRAGKTDDAHQLFGVLVSSYPSSSLVQQALYWQAKTGPTSEAAQLYRDTVRAAPLTYYAALARQRLAMLHAEPEPAPLRAALPSSATAPTEPLVELAVELDAVGLARERGEALDAASHSTSGEVASYQLALVAARLGEWGRAYGLANGRLWHRAFEEHDPGSLALLFPRAYRDAVETSSSNYGFDPAFVWAIMRRESAFDPSVESAARAIGLMQMLQPTAKKIALLLDQSPPDVDQLHQPAREIPISVWYLAELSGRFGLAGLAAAAYNAGPVAVANWVGKIGALPFDEFVEAIPFRETRAYVKNVLGDYLAYRTLYPSASPELPMGSAIPPASAGANF